MSEDRIPQPKDAIEFLSRKNCVETERWDDMKHGEHSHAFTAAHTAGAGIVEDIFKIMNESLAQGMTFRDFKKQMIPLMEEKGWYGRGDEKDGGKSRDEGKKTGGKGTYTNWRLKLIYEVNSLNAFSAGRTRQMLRIAHRRPWWMYLSLMKGKNRRKAHKLLHKKVFHYKNPFWEIYDPANGWCCKCSKKSLSDSELKRQGITPMGIEDIPEDFKNSVPDEWQYSPGREMIAPNFSKYEYLNNYTMNDGRKAVDVVKEQYIKDVAECAMRQGEWEVWSEAILKDDYSPQEIQILAATLDSNIFETLKEDPKIFLTDSIILEEKNNFTMEEIKGLQVLFSSPEKIYQDNEYYYFTDKGLSARFKKTLETISFQLKGFEKFNPDKMKNKNLIYRRSA